MTRSKLDLHSDHPLYGRIISFDPEEVYSRITVNDTSRFNNVSMRLMFPTLEKGICACGCGRPAKKRWHNKNCSDFAFTVRQIIAGSVAYIRPIIQEIYGTSCSVCGITSKEAGIDNLFRSNIHLEHTVPVHLGGGGCWLSNYSMMCVHCHKEKTRREMTL